MERESNVINFALEQWVEEALPSQNVNLWPAIQAQLRGKVGRSQKRTSTTRTAARNLRLRITTSIILAVLIILATLFATHQGRALAQNIIHFFTRSEGNTLFIPTPTAVSLVAVTQGVPLPAVSPTVDQILLFAAQCGDLSFPKCTLDQIRSLVTFKVMALADGHVPSDLDFIGATGGPDQVWLVYRSKDLSRSIFLLEGTKAEQGFLGFKISANTTVEDVQIGDAAGEYVKGNWNTPSGKGEMVWDPNMPVQFLRWSTGGLYYEINAFSNPDDFSPWSGKTGLLLLAAGLTSTPATPTPELVNDNLTIAQAEVLAGFHILVPDKLPREYTFSDASYSPSSQTVCLVYKHPDDYGASLTIAESATMSFPALNDLFLSWPNYGWHINAETLKVGGGLGGWGMLIKGSLNYNQFCVGNVGTPVGSYSPETEVLQLQAQGLMISIYAKEFPSLREHNFTTQLELLRIAESITGVHTVPDDQLDPEYLLDVKDAEAFVGFHVQIPTKLFPGEAFSYFRVVPEGWARSVTIMYENNLWITETFLPGRTLDSIFNEEPKSDQMYQKVTVKSQPGLLYAEPGNLIVITWFENGIQYQLSGVYDGQPVDVWLSIAESMK